MLNSNESQENLLIILENCDKCIVLCISVSLTLVGLGVSGNQVLEFKAVRSHLLLRLAANSCHVAVLHLTRAAAGTRVDAHSKRLTYKTEKNTNISWTVDRETKLILQ